MFARAAVTMAVVLGLIAPASAGPRETYFSEAGGLGRIEFDGRTGAVLQRDEGIVSLFDTRGGKPKLLGRYDDGATGSLDGDLAFSEDGHYLFYARQTKQFSKDGLHVIDVGDPEMPLLATYHPLGGAYRVASYADGSGEWVFVLDATHGLVVFAFEPETGQVAPVAVDALPALKVGGPASAGIHIDPKDPATGLPLLYVTTGETGLHVYDISNPASPAEIGRWADVGLAEIEVASSKRSRTVYAATEYWFDKTLEPEVVVLDATKLDKIEEKARFSVPGAEADPMNQDRIQGMALAGKTLYAAHSTLGLVGFDAKGRITQRLGLGAGKNPGPNATTFGGPYAMDVEVRKEGLYVTDASFGRLLLFGR